MKCFTFKKYKEQIKNKKKLCSFEELCIICYDEYNPDDKIQLITSCKHIFHLNCFNNWLRKKRKCPLCKTNINR